MSRIVGIPEDRGYATPCLIWQGATNTNGYGVIRHEGRNRVVHVLAYEETKGPIPDGLELDHLCGVHACLNVDHLEPVTHVENMRRGKSTRLTAADVAAIRASTSKPRELAEQYGVHVSWIHRIRRGRTANRYGPATAWA